MPKSLTQSKEGLIGRMATEEDPIEREAYAALNPTSTSSSL